MLTHPVKFFEGEWRANVNASTYMLFHRKIFMNKHKMCVRHKINYIHVFE